MTNFLTIRQAAEGFCSGNRFYINVSAFRETLDRKSRANVRADAAQ